jgi:type IV secretory pathway ATPase VirB11/archaellum biosynthesis ATPase
MVVACASASGSFMGFDHPHLSSAGPKSATLRVQFELGDVSHLEPDTRVNIRASSRARHSL